MILKVHPRASVCVKVINLKYGNNWIANSQRATEELAIRPSLMDGANISYVVGKLAPDVSFLGRAVAHCGQIWDKKKQQFAWQLVLRNISELSSLRTGQGQKCIKSQAKGSCRIKSIWVQRNR